MEKTNASQPVAEARGPGHRPLLSALFLSALAIGVSACGNDPGTPGSDAGDQGDNDIHYPNPIGLDYGEPCSVDADCKTDYCSVLNPRSDAAFCTFRCTQDSDCPSEPDSACIFITNAQHALTRICAPDDLCIDKDGDGFGSGPACKGPDCDDDNASVHPGAPEICDNIDNDCDGLIDNNVVTNGQECDTTQPGECGRGLSYCQQGAIQCLVQTIPGARQEICDGLDNDCDGQIDEGPPGAGVENNNPNDINYIIGLHGQCGDDDGTGCFRGVMRCDAEQQRLYCDGDVVVQDLPDMCDGIDNNCDGQIDEDYRAQFPEYGQPCSAGLGTCKADGVFTCHPTNPSAPPVCSVVAVDANSVPETCNFNDDDCDGVPDNGFVDANGIYNTVEHCGACDNSCLQEWGGDPAAYGVIPACVVTGGNATCSFTCAEGFVDHDRLRDTGCELKPDLEAVYVATSAKGGADIAACGTYDKPCASITYALSIATSKSRKRLIVSEGSFAGGFTMENGISILGGHSSKSWERNINVYLTALQGGKTEGDDTYAIKASGITLATELSGFTIQAPDATKPSGNSIGIWVVNSTDALTISDNTILGGRGGAGADGGGGGNGTAAQPGKDGANRVNDKTTCQNGANGYVLAGGAGGANTCGGASTAGGAGAHTTCPGTVGVINANNGRASAGSGAANTSANGAGLPGDSMWHSSPGIIDQGVPVCNTNNGPASPTAGRPGATGADGTGGNGATDARGIVVGGRWVGSSGATGAAGTSGGGGGGGGSSGGILQADGVFHYGATGGGGGGGGCGATGGHGGKAGGASFGIFLSFASNTAPPIITGNTINRGNGGRGGQGGIGGVGGAGGAAGNGGVHTITAGNWSRCGQHAAAGGAGGRGGHGGGGGGGAGGISYDIVVANNNHANVDAYATSNQFPLGNTVTGGGAGLGGDAIKSPGKVGIRGQSGTLLKL